MYRADSDVNLPLKVSDLLLNGTTNWNRDMVSDTFSPEDAERIMLMKQICLKRTLSDGASQRMVLIAPAVVISSQMPCWNSRVSIIKLCHRLRKNYGVTYGKSKLLPRSSISYGGL